MVVLVAYATRGGSTQGIAERIAATLKASGHDVDLQSIKENRDLVERYDAFVIGSAAYMGSWLKEAAEFVRRNRAVLAGKPVWLFSSGPLGTATTDAKGQDLLVASEPKEFAEFKEAIQPRGVQVFFGALDASTCSFGVRLLRLLPGGRTLLPLGDFRDWKAIEAWADRIARELAPVTASTG